MEPCLNPAFQELDALRNEIVDNFKMTMDGGNFQLYDVSVQVTERFASDLRSVYMLYEQLNDIDRKLTKLRD